MPTPATGSNESVAASTASTPTPHSGPGRGSRSSRPPTRRGTPVSHVHSSSSKHMAPAATNGQTRQNAGLSGFSEPPLAAPKASYKEYDDRALVNASTQFMQPLGELPTSKMVDATKKPQPHQTKKRGKNAHATTPGPKANGSTSATPSASASASGSGNGVGNTPREGQREGAGTGAGGAEPEVRAESRAETPVLAGAGAGTASGAGTAMVAVVGTTAGIAGPSQPNQANVSTTPGAAGSADASTRTSGSPSANASATTTPRPPPANPWFNGNAPSSKTPQGRARLSMVVDAAIQRSAVVGNIDIGKAIKKLYDASLNNHRLAELLDAVLAQKARPEQVQEFQSYVRYARENPESMSLLGPEHDAELNGEGSGEVAATHEEKMPVKIEPDTVPGTNGSTNLNGGIERKTKKERKRNGVGRRSDGNQDAEDTDSDLSSVSSEIVEESKRAASTATQSKASSPHAELRDRDLEHPSKRAKVPTYNEVSHIRDPPPPPTRTRGRKRPRSPSMISPPPPAAATPATTSPTLAPLPPLTPQHPPKKRSKTNKIKVSPVKKAPATENAVVTAGIGEAAEHRRRFGSEEVSENEDVCAVCNGSGRFLCCERCPRSFHFSCLNPPLEDIPEGMWFCNKCTAQTNPPPKEQRGLFSELIDNINRRNPTSFRLPLHIRSYFIGVETGPLGEYADTRDVRTQRYNKSGFVEEYDTHKLKDKQGNPILCHDCGKSAVDGQRIISCDYCPLSWHLDCIRPMPMSNPPPGTKKWMCPAHVDWVLHRRRPKNAKIQDTYLRRGHKNDGLIEVMNEEEDPFEEVTISGVVYRLPERGIKLDFLDKVKRSNEITRAKRRKLQHEGVENNGTTTPLSETPSRFIDTTVPQLQDRPIVDQQIVQSLLELKSKERLGTLTENTIQNLIQALLEGASPAHIGFLSESRTEVTAPPLSPAASIADSTASPLEHERQQLLALQELISKRLQVLSGTNPELEQIPITPADNVIPISGGMTSHNRETNGRSDVESQSIHRVDPESEHDNHSKTSMGDGKVDHSAVNGQQAAVANAEQQQELTPLPTTTAEKGSGPDKMQEDESNDIPITLPIQLEVPSLPHSPSAQSLSKPLAESTIPTPDQSSQATGDHDAPVASMMAPVASMMEQAPTASMAPTAEEKALEEQRILEERKTLEEELMDIDHMDQNIDHMEF